MHEGFATDFANEFARRLRQLRAARKLTQADLANAIGCSQGTITNWERGADSRRGSLPSADDLCLLAQALEVSLDWLLRPPHHERTFLIDTEIMGDILRTTEDGPSLDRAWWAPIDQASRIVHSEGERDALVERVDAHVGEIRKRWRKRR